MMRIQHISIPRPRGSDEATRQFYSALLGLEEKPVPRSLDGLDLLWFQVGDLELHCYGTDEINDAKGRHFCLEVDDVAAMRARLTEAGVFTRDTVPIPGRPRFFAHDPFGNVIEFTTIVADYRELEGKD